MGSFITMSSQGLTLGLLFATLPRALLSFSQVKASSLITSGSSVLHKESLDDKFKQGTFVWYMQLGITVTLIM